MSMEDGLPQTMPLLNGPNAINGHGGSGGETGSSRATAVLVLSTFVSVCGFFTIGCITGYASPAESGIKKDLGLSTAEFAVFASIATVGGMIGAVVCGKTADVLGRKGTMWVGDIFFSFGWLSIALASNAFWLDLGMLSNGIGFGLITYVTPVYIAEITPKNLRGIFTSSTNFILCIGFSLIYFLGTFITWRHLALVGCSGSFMQIVGLFFIPESPRWLAKVGSRDLEASLQRLRGKKVDIAHEATEIQEHTETFENVSKSSIFTLFQRRYAHALIVGVGLMMLQQFSGTNAISAYASNIFESAGYSTTIGSIVIAIVQIPATAVGTLLTDKTGRRPLLLSSAAGMCFGCLIVGLSFLLQDIQLGTKISPVASLIGLMIFPVNVKASAGTIVSLSYWISSWVVTYSFSFLFDWSSAGVFFIYAAVCGFTVLFVAKLVPETKLRQLEEIQASMNHFT